MKITGETTIFKNENGSYSTSISNKKQDGTYEYMSISVTLKKGTEIENKTKINILDGFLSFYKTKEGMPKLKLIIMDFEYLMVDALKIMKGEDNFVTVEDTDELPF